MSTTCPPYGGGECGSTPTTTVTTVGTPVHKAPGDLPFTGGDVIGLSIIGVGAIVIGSFLARARRHNAA